VDHLEHCDALEGEIALFATVLLDADAERAVPSCPEWSILQLSEHLGRVHRWAEYLVRHLAPTRVSPQKLPPDRGPVDSIWIREGGDQLLATLRGTDPNLDMWAWGADQHVRFWSRRQHHETMIHRIDLQLAMDRQPEVDGDRAADAIDEFLVNLPAAAAFSPRSEKLAGVDGRLAFRDVRTGSRWVVRPGTSGGWLTHDEDPVDVEFAANGIDLLLILYRRRSLAEIDGLVKGDEALLQFWLEHSVLE
jgi:uncharacterized protein (TIGR03083 family)